MSFTCFFFFNDTATTEIYTLSLHDALPILVRPGRRLQRRRGGRPRRRRRLRGHRRHRRCRRGEPPVWLDRKSTRLNSSHVRISYAVFCLKKKKQSTFITHVSATLEHSMRYL